MGGQTPGKAFFSPPGQSLPSSVEQKGDGSAGDLSCAVDRPALICLSIELSGRLARPDLAWPFEAHKVDLCC